MTRPVPTLEDLQRVAAQAFGFMQLRPGQAAAMLPLAAGRDVLLVMPPGSGKSAVFQVPGRALGGLTVGVSPLLALQRDQVDALATRPAAGAAAALNGTLTAEAHAGVLAQARAGELCFLYLGPEQLMRSDVVEALAAAAPTLFVVDEAHCISQWGMDFRPDYLRLAPVIEAVGRPPVMASTATASPPVRAEIAARLGLHDPVVLVRGFDRPELHLAVTPVLSDADTKRRLVIEQAAGMPKPVLMYVATRAATGELARELADLGLSAVAYHGTMPAKARAAVETRWLADEIDVLVATSAFGMGVDKPNVRCVVHADPPDSLESYLQEVGRAGRDGLPAEALMAWRPEDLGVRRFFTGGAPRRSALTRVAATIRAAGRPVNEAELAEELGWSRIRVVRNTDLLMQTRMVLSVTGASNGQTWLEASPDAPEPMAMAAAALSVAHDRRLGEQSRIDMVRAFAETQDCRRQLLLSSFGEVLPRPCGNCDRCDHGATDHDQVDGTHVPYPAGSAVEHSEWGPGLVTQIDTDRVTVLFDSVGYRTMSLAAVAAHGLLSTPVTALAS